MQSAVSRSVKLPPGYAVSWSGQFEYLERATERLKLVVPLTLAVILVLLYLLFRSFSDAALVMAAVPFSLVGGFWLVWALGHSLSVASAVGFIALAGSPPSSGRHARVPEERPRSAACCRRARQRRDAVAAIRKAPCFACVPRR
jgi:Cu/Ag efflux pump CusA